MLGSRSPSAGSEASEEKDDDLTYLEFVDGKSSKFWQVVVSGSSHTVTYGRIGTNGQSKTKDFADEDAARKDADKQAGKKRAKGYKDATPPG